MPTPFDTFRTNEPFAVEKNGNVVYKPENHADFQDLSKSSSWDMKLSSAKPSFDSLNKRGSLFVGVTKGGQVYAWHHNPNGNDDHNSLHVDQHDNPLEAENIRSLFPEGYSKSILHHAFSRLNAPLNNINENDQRMELWDKGGNEHARFNPLNKFLQLHDPVINDSSTYDSKLFNASNIKYDERYINKHGYDPGMDEEIYDKYNADVDEWMKISKQSAADTLKQYYYRHFRDA